MSNPQKTPFKLLNISPIALTIEASQLTSFYTHTKNIQLIQKLKWIFGGNVVEVIAYYLLDSHIFAKVYLFILEIKYCYLQCDAAWSTDIFDTFKEYIDGKTR